MAEVENAQESVKAEVSKVTRNQVMKVMIRWAIIESEVDCLGSNPGSNTNRGW